MPVGEHRRHAQGFAAALLDQAPQRGLDLGSGGGVPGLVLAAHWPGSFWVLLDRDGRRAGFLDRAVLELGWADRVVVVHERAEAAGRDSKLRATFDLVCARSFGVPAVVAECGAPFLCVGGHLVASDPPTGGAERWPEAELDQFGLRLEGHHEAPGAHFTVLKQVAPCPDSWPRRPGVPAKRPRF